MSLPDYLSHVARYLNAESDLIRLQFEAHHPTAGENREHLVQIFLSDHLPRRFVVDAGMVLSSTGAFARQADVVVADGLNNSPLHAGRRHRIWPVEALYALIEVKTSLTKSELRDAIAKGRRFKSLERHFSKLTAPRSKDSLFVVWGFGGPKDPKTIKRNLIHELKDVPSEERPDFVVLPNRLLAMSGQYLAQTFPMADPNSQQGASGNIVKVWDCGENSLLVWFSLFKLWLEEAGERTYEQFYYLGPEPLGKEI